MSRRRSNCSPANSETLAQIGAVAVSDSIAAGELQPIQRYAASGHQHYEPGEAMEKSVRLEKNREAGVWPDYDADDSDGSDADDDAASQRRAHPNGLGKPRKGKGGNGGKGGGNGGGKGGGKGGKGKGKGKGRKGWRGNGKGKGRGHGGARSAS